MVFEAVFEDAIEIVHEVFRNDIHMMCDYLCKLLEFCIHLRIYPLFQLINLRIHLRIHPFLQLINLRINLRIHPFLQCLEVVSYHLDIPLEEPDVPVHGSDGLLQHPDVPPS